MEFHILNMKSALQNRPLKKVQAPKRAAVCALLSFTKPYSLLMIKRAEHPLDPWSGHMGLPGGRCEPEESDLDAAIRESQEELGLELKKTQVLGRLDDVQAVGHGRVIPMAIAPFIFYCKDQPRTIPDPREVQEVLWVPLDFLRDDGQLSTTPYTFKNIERELPCYIYQERKIWGLTFRMIRELLKYLP
ncbi:MAG: CoA pyrophosphatase [Planctomycetota bacterium]|nr:CoA pyrophosphatase [Planctomycetota bacterium]